MSTTDRIHIRNLSVETHIGVPEAERAAPQQLLVSLVLEPLHAFEAMSDDVSLTIDYAEVCRQVEALAAARARRLLETLASDIAALVLREFRCAEVEVEIRKFILPQTDHVAVSLVRRR